MFQTENRPLYCCYVIGQIESTLAMDIGYTAVTAFGAWYAGGIFDVLIGWCE